MSNKQHDYYAYIEPEMNQVLFGHSERHIKKFFSELPHVKQANTSSNTVKKLEEKYDIEIEWTEKDVSREGEDKWLVNGFFVKEN